MKQRPNRVEQNASENTAQINEQHAGGIMNILVCIKQVPDTTEIKIDPVTNTLIRSGVPSIVNPYDAYALEAAVRLKEEHGGRVTVLSMGPEQAGAALRTCLAVGADDAFLLSDRAFSGSDTLATSFILSEAVRYLESKLGTFSLILCGRQAIDGDTAQVGPEIAEHLERPQITCAYDLSLEYSGVAAKRENENGYDRIFCELPAVLTVIRISGEVRLPSVRSRMLANKAVIETISAESLRIDTLRCGLRGSPTRVKKTFTPVRAKTGVIIRGTSAEAAAKKLAVFLYSEKLI